MLYATKLYSSSILKFWQLYKEKLNFLIIRNTFHMKLGRPYLRNGYENIHGGLSIKKVKTLEKSVSWPEVTKQLPSLSCHLHNIILLIISRQLLHDPLRTSTNKHWIVQCYFMNWSGWKTMPSENLSVKFKLLKINVNGMQIHYHVTITVLYLFFDIEDGAYQ